MDSFPAFVPLKGARVAVVGDGDAAEAKARLFDGSPATLVRLTAEAAAAPGALSGVRLVFVATPDARQARKVAEAAKAAGALVNVVDRPEICDFTTPAIVDRGAIVAAVGTTGSAPVLAALLRAEIEARWPEGLGRLGELSLKVQSAVRNAYPDLPARRAFWRRLIGGPAAEAAMDGDLTRAEDLVRQEIEAKFPVRGRVWFLTAPSDPERLTLAALRALGAADRIVAGGDVEAGVLGYARRDALRSEAATPAELAGWAAAGLSVLRLAAELDRRELEAVRDAGAEIELLPSAP
jgi:precorrin-2 dehydrogenase/sirohydrochlorin ferrochelatase